MRSGNLLFTEFNNYDLIVIFKIPVVGHVITLLIDINVLFNNGSVTIQ